MPDNKSKMLETDYLIVGGGAVGLSFADVMLTETNASMIIVDRLSKPGGHWNMAYSFVTLHQPALYYGVSSTELSNGTKDEVGLNKGLYELASGARINAYFDEVMNHRFLPSGQVRYFPLCDYQGDGKFKSIITGECFEVKVNKKIVDATYLKTTIPATHTPGFHIAPEVKFLPINDLIHLTEPSAGYVIIGAGKTGIDACLWLLEHRVDPDQITWIMPRDSWFFNRVNNQPTEDFFEFSIGSLAAQFEAIATATSIVDMFDRLEASNVLMRLDKNVRPAMFHGASITPQELEQLQRIKNIIRMGRVKSIEQDKIILDKGAIPTSLETIHVDCSASGISNSEIVPVFKGNTITLQCVMAYQTVASAAFIAHIEATYHDEKHKNELCAVVPLPNHDTDWMKTLASNVRNKSVWNQDVDLRKWLYNNRLDGFSRLIANVSPDDKEKQAIIKRMHENIKPAMKKLHQLISEFSEPIKEKLPLTKGLQ
jgi:microcompartment protein CcmL/EutN